MPHPAIVQSGGLAGIPGDEWPIIIAGALVSILATAVVRWLVWGPIRGMRKSRIVRRSQAKRRGEISSRFTVLSAESQPTGTRIGSSFEFPWVSIDFARYRDADIEATLSGTRPEYLPEVTEWCDEIVASYAKVPVPGVFNGQGLRLLAFDERDRTGVEERPRLILKFVETDYFHSLASDQRLDLPFAGTDGRVTTLRTKYFRDHDLRQGPMQGIAGHFGVQISVVTSDNKLIVPQRGATAVGANAFGPSAAEGALPAHDVVAAGRYLPQRSAARALQEELAVDQPPAVTWQSFGANYLTGQYALVGYVQIEQTFDEVRTLHELAVAKDKWESRKLYGVTFSPEAFAEFVEDHPETHWLPFATITFVHHLIAEFGVKRVERALGSTTVKSAQ